MILIIILTIQMILIKVIISKNSIDQFLLSNIS